MAYSRKKITKAGNILLSSKSKEEVDEALDVINEWRTNHLHPLRVLKNNLIKLCKNHNISPALVSQRLKRLTSIQYKLDLNKNMGLGGMQDIGGYRAVLKDVKDLKKLRSILELTNKNHRLEKIVDYVALPKKSGYRRIHLVYTYHSRVEKYTGLKLELQIRTKLQHNWATAVETAGIITKTSLKSSQGPDEWLDFFRIVSSLFAIKEKLPVLETHQQEPMQELMIKCFNLCKKLNVIDTLKALRVTTKHLEGKNFPGDYYLINISIEEKKVGVNVFDKKSFTEATNEYLRLEKSIEDTKNAVVLVSASSIKSLKKAYPSYFLDTSEFLQALEKINQNCVTLGFVK